MVSQQEGRCWDSNPSQSDRPTFQTQVWGIDGLGPGGYTKAVRVALVVKEGRAAALSFPVNLSGKTKKKESIVGVMAVMGSRESGLTGQFGPAVRTPEHLEGVWGSLVSGGLGDIGRETRAGQWGPDAPLWTRPHTAALGTGPSTLVWVCFACGSLCPGLEQGQDVDVPVLVSDPPHSFPFGLYLLGVRSGELFLASLLLLSPGRFWTEDPLLLPFLWLVGNFVPSPIEMPLWCVGGWF